MPPATGQKTTRFDRQRGPGIACEGSCRGINDVQRLDGSIRSQSGGPRRGDFDVLGAVPGGFSRIDGIITSLQGSIAKTAGIWIVILQKLSIVIGPASHKRDVAVAVQVQVHDSVATACADIRCHPAFPAETQSGSRTTRQAAEGDRTLACRVVGVAHVNVGLAGDNRHSPEHLVPRHRVGIVAGRVFNSDASCL